MKSPPPVLLAGIGNDLMGDDGLGPFLIRRLARAYVASGELELAETGVSCFQLMDLLAGRRAAVLVDALNVEGAEPGRVLRFDKSRLLAAEPSRFSPHQPALRETILAAEALGGPVESVILYGVQGGSFEMGEGLSPAAAASLDELEAAVVSELHRLGVGLEPRRSELLE